MIAYIVYKELFVVTNNLVLNLMFLFSEICLFYLSMKLEEVH